MIFAADLNLSFYIFGSDSGKNVIQLYGFIWNFLKFLHLKNTNSIALTTVKWEAHSLKKNHHSYICRGFQHSSPDDSAKTVLSLWFRAFSYLQAQTYLQKHRIENVVGFQNGFSSLNTVNHKAASKETAESVVLSLLSEASHSR